MKKLIFILIAICTLSVIPSHAATIYFAPSSAGSNNGTSCANAYAWTDATNGIHTTGATASWAAGNVLVLCQNNTFTCPAAGGSGIVVAGSGSSGNPITIQFQSNAVLSCTYWGTDPINVATAAAIFCNGHPYITVDGGTNGTIQNTANGSPGLGYANAQGSGGVLFNGCPNSEIKNLIVKNIYIHQAGSSDTAGTGVTGCISAGYNGSAGASGTLIHNNTVSQCSQGIGLGYESTGSGQNITSASIYNNTVDVACHFISIGDGTGGSSASNISVYGNTIGSDFNTWIDSTSACHQDGMIISAFNTSPSASLMTNLSIYNNQISAGACTVSGGNFTGYIFLTGGFTNTNIFNNILNAAVTTNGCQLQGLIRLDPGTPNLVMTTARILNNTVDMGSISNSSGATNDFLAINGANATNFSGFDVRNNVAINFANGGGVYGLTNNSGSSFAQAFTAIDYNVYNTNIGKFGHDDQNGQDYVTFTNWQTPNAINSFPGEDAHGSQVGSILLNSNYTPQSGSPVINACTNLTSLAITALNSDKAGSARPSTGNWTCGAYNFSTAPAPYSGGQMVGQIAPPTNLRAILIAAEEK